MNKFACGTCLYLNENITSFVLVQDVKHILELCVPEIKPHLTKNTIICRQCFYFLKNIENFKIRCIENQRKMLNYNAVAHCSTQNFQPIPRTSVAFIPAAAGLLTTGDKQKSETIISSRKVVQEPKVTSKATLAKSKFPKQSSNIGPDDVIELSDSEVELNDTTKLSYSENSYDEDDIFEEHPKSLSTIVKSEPEDDINPSFFNKKSEEGYYHCKLCTKKYKQSQGLYNHTLSEHKELKFYHCNLCNFFTLWKSALGRHESFFHVEGEIEELYLFCYHCTYKTRSKKELEDHIQIHFNNKTTTYTCPKCKRNFTKKSLYDFHMESHEKGKITICDYCDKSYTKKYIKRHLLEIHGIRETYCFG